MLKSWTTLERTTSTNPPHKKNYEMTWNLVHAQVQPQVPGEPCERDARLRSLCLFFMFSVLFGINVDRMGALRIVTVASAYDARMCSCVFGEIVMFLSPFIPNIVFVSRTQAPSGKQYEPSSPRQKGKSRRAWVIVTR